jgi:hypothetical protein
VRCNVILDCGPLPLNLSEKDVEASFDLLSGKRSHGAVNHLAVVVEEEGRHTLDCVVGRSLRRIVDVYLCEFHFSRVALCQFIQNRF